MAFQWSLTHAEEYLKRKVKTFFDLGTEFQTAFARLDAVKANAHAHNDQERMGNAIVLESQLQQLASAHRQWEDRMTEFAKAFHLTRFLPHTPQLGQLSIVLAAVAIPAAIFLYSHIKASELALKKLDLIEKGTLTPAQANAVAPSEPSSVASLFSGITSAASSVSTLVIVGGLALLGYAMLSGRKSHG